MSNNRSYTWAEIRSGLFVLFVAGILGSLLFYCNSSPFIQKNYPVYADFNYIAGLKKDSPVQLAGHEIGRVSDIRFVPGEENRVRITLLVYQNTVLHQNARVFIEVMGFMGEKYVEIQTGDVKSPVLKPGSILKGEDPIAIMEMVHRGVLLMDDFEKISQNMDNVVKQLESLLDNNKGNIQGILDNLNVSSANLKDMTQDLKWHPWKLLRKGKEHRQEDQKD